jgi:hypothetical protein
MMSLDFSIDQILPTALWPCMSTKDLSGGKGRPARKADNLTSIGDSIILQMWEPRRLAALWASTICYRNSFSFYLDLVADTERRNLDCLQTGYQNGRKKKDG